MNKLLSIIIPTKNRYQTLLPLIDMLLGFQLNELEIVVQDNSDNNEEFTKFIGTLNGDNLRYFYEKKKLSVIENSDLAIKNSTGKYVCFIGDDDGVMPYIMEVVKWMDKKGYGILKGSKPNYTWPNLKSNYLSNDQSGVLVLRKINYEVKNVDTQKALIRMLERGGANIHDLAGLYHGIVRRDILDKIFLQCNTFFPGPSPDMASAVALCLVCDSYVYVDYPVVISGKSSSSTGGQGRLHKHVGKIEEVAHLPAETSVQWDVRIPKYWTGPTIWAESVLKTLERMGYPEYISKLNFTNLYAAIYVLNYNSRKIIFKDFKYNFSGNFLIQCTKVLFVRSSFFFKNYIHNTDITIKNIPTIKEAVNHVIGKIDPNKIIYK